MYLIGDTSDSSLSSSSSSSSEEETISILTATEVIQSTRYSFRVSASHDQLVI